MPHKPPIERRQLKKQGLLNEKDFFRKLQASCNYVDEETVHRFYMGLVKTITKELRDHNVVRLPHLGDFALVAQKPKTLIVGNRREIRGANILKFYPKFAWRQYFTTRENNK
jgi:nucleoid DNA-binding protein